MELEFKKDFESAKKNWDRFWAGTLDRPIIVTGAYKKGAEQVPAPKWGAAFSEDIEKVVEQSLKRAENYEFLVDAVPFFTPSLMVDLIPALLGAEMISVKEAWGTDSHALPFIKDLESADIRFRKDSIWWEKWVKLCECIKRKCSGRMIMGSASPGYNNLDTLGALRGTTELLMDLYDNPQGVHSVMRKVMKAYNEIADEHCRIFGAEFKKYGCVTHHGFYSSGLIAVPQCDFGFNIGKEHFDEFALPYLKEEIDRLDVAEYHLDGPGNIPHTESVCSIEKIGVIQWVAGAGNEKKDWTPLYEKINSLDKGLLLWADSPEMAVSAWEKYGRPKRMILTVESKTKDDGMRYLEAFEKRKRPV